MRNAILERLVDSAELSEADVARRVNRFPYFSRIDGATGPRTVIEGREFLNFGSNNYLGLADDSRTKAAAHEAIDRWGCGVTGSRLLNGNLALHEQFEAELATFFRRDAALVFPTGYTANMGLMTGILRPKDHAFIDSDMHASVIDGVLLSRARFRRIRHNDVNHFRTMRKESPIPPAACIIEGLYSMRGDLAPVGEFVQACHETGAISIVDEAHSFGTIGDRGAGVCERDGVLGTASLITITFSKSLGSCGGAVIGDARVLDALRFHSRPFLFTASNTPGSIGAARAALAILVDEPELVAAVATRARDLRVALAEHGVPVGPGEQGPIITIPTGSDFRTLQLWRMAYNRGLFVNPVISPAVAQGFGLLRLSVMATHNETHIDEAAEICAAIFRSCPPSAWDVPAVEKEPAP